MGWSSRLPGGRRATSVVGKMWWGGGMFTCGRVQRQAVRDGAKTMVMGAMRGGAAKDGTMAGGGPRDLPAAGPRPLRSVGSRPAACDPPVARPVSANMRQSLHRHDPAGCVRSARGRSASTGSHRGWREAISARSSRSAGGGAASARSPGARTAACNPRAARPTFVAGPHPQRSGQPHVICPRRGRIRWIPQAGRT